MPGFAFNFLMPRFFKALILLPISFFLVLPLLFIRSYKTIIYRPDARHLPLLNNLRNVLVIGCRSDKLWAVENGYAFFYFYPFYSFSHLGADFIWRLVFSKTLPQRILVWTDFGLDQYLAVRLSQRYRFTSWCLQHGLFPSHNNNDLDGFDCNVNVVSSQFQLDILRRSGYRGNTKVCKQLFESSSKNTSSVSSWTRYGRQVVFVGPGYSHAPDQESHLINLLVKLKYILGPNFKLIYRPHPRDDKVLKKIQIIGVPCIRDNTSSFIDDRNPIFIGIKSTFLVEAQNAGRNVFLLVGDMFPRYFEHGEIRFELNIDNLEALLEHHLFKI